VSEKEIVVENNKTFPLFYVSASQISVEKIVVIIDFIFVVVAATV
jgi:hypothetical protein